MKCHRVLTIASAALLLTSCGDAFSPEGVSGFYELMSADGTSLPYSQTYVQNGVSVEMTFNDGAVTLNENGTWGSSWSYDLNSGGSTLSETLTSSGTFTLVEPATVQFINEWNEQSAGTLDGHRLTMIVAGHSYLYEK